MDISRGIRRCNQVLKIIITGPESSGKTTLCSQLSTYFKYPLVSEYAREYIDQLDRSYNKDDLLEISKEQRNREFTGGKILLCDTDLITIKIWSLFKYNSCDEKIIDPLDVQANLLDGNWKLKDPSSAVKDGNVEQTFSSVELIMYGSTKIGGNFSTINSSSDDVWPTSGSWNFHNDDPNQLIWNMFAGSTYSAYVLIDHNTVSYTHLTLPTKA